MAHYALLDNENIVTQVFVGRDEDDLVEGVTSWEDYYGDLHGMTCKRTSYNTQAGQHATGGVAYRLNYAAVGYRYDPVLDGFIEPQPWPSWTLDETTGTWVPPVPVPHIEGHHYQWDEDGQTWLLSSETPVPHPGDGNLYDWDDSAQTWRPVD